jgi:lipoate-protein ligase A
MWVDHRVMERYEEALTLALWVPKGLGVVLGRNNRESECFGNRCLEDQVPIARRCGGGGTVLLHPGCLIFTCGVWVKERYHNSYYISQLNESLMRSLPQTPSWKEQGFGDITVEGKKLVGVSLFRSGHYLLYQASLLVKNAIHLIEQYLPHPTEEPLYRNKKEHRFFLTSYEELGLESDPSALYHHGAMYWPFLVEQILKDSLISPKTEECQALKNRLKEEQPFALAPLLLCFPKGIFSNL